MKSKTKRRLATTGRVVAGTIAVGVLAKAAVCTASAAVALAFWGVVGTSLAYYLGSAIAGTSRDK